MRTDIFKRCVWLLDTIALAGKDGITLIDIEKCWRKTSMSMDCPQYPRRTFENHREKISELLGITIKCHRSTNRYYIDETECLVPKGMASRLFVDAAALDNTVSKTSSLKERIMMDDIPSDEDYLVKIIEAMSRDKSINIEYHAFDKDKTISYPTIEPLGLRVYDRRWYMVARIPDDGRIRIFALDRMEGVAVTEKSFTMPSDFSLEEYFDGCFGMMRGGNATLQRIVLKVEKYQANYLKTLPLHDSQHLVSEDESFSVFSYFLKPMLDFRQKLLSFGGTVEVVEPSELRKEIMSEIEKMKRLYK